MPTTRASPPGSGTSDTDSGRTSARPAPVADPSSTRQPSAQDLGAAPLDAGRQTVVQPDELGDERRGGRAYTSAGAPICSSRPARMTPTRSATASASSWSWVTNSVVVPTSSCTPPDLVAQLHPHLGVQRGERLVEQQHARLDGERAGQRDPLLLAAGELVGVAVGLLGEAHQVQHLAGRGRRSRLALPRSLQSERDVVERGQVREEAVGLEDHAHVALVRRHAR